MTQIEKLKREITAIEEAVKTAKAGIKGLSLDTVLNRKEEFLIHDVYIGCISEGKMQLILHFEDDTREFIHIQIGGIQC